MVAFDLGDWARDAVGGSVLLAMPVALLAGLVSFFSPCVLPLLPGYLSYASGLSVTEVQEGGRRGRVLAGTALFVLGFAIVFVSGGVLFGTLGTTLMTWRTQLNVIGGVLAIVLGLVVIGVVGTIVVSQLNKGGTAAGTNSSVPVNATSDASGIVVNPGTFKDGVPKVEVFLDYQCPVCTGNGIVKPLFDACRTI